MTNLDPLASSFAALGEPTRLRLMLACRERDLLVGTSSDPKVVRLLPPLTLEKQHVDTLANALSDIGH